MKKLLYLSFLISSPLCADDLIHQAAASHDFYGVRNQLWNNVSAQKKSDDGRAPKNYLRGGKENYTAINLLLRCYAFCESMGVPAQRPKVQHDLALISDSSVDYHNKTWKSLYVLNQAEKNGKPGVDDDKNGFIDDIYGWNFADDTPLRRPMDITLSVPKGYQFTKDNLTEYLAIREGKRKEDPNQPMDKRYRNPLVHEVGYYNFQRTGLQLSDKFFAELSFESSHGTHVAGIVHEASLGEVRLHGTVFTSFSPNGPAPHKSSKFISQLALNSPDYTTFVANYRKAHLKNSTERGLRRSRYFEQMAPGVVNMSWGGSIEGFRNLANLLQSIYRSQGKNPASIDSHACPIGLDLCDDLAIELMAAHAAETALTFYRNPETLFVIAAGNEGQNNDSDFALPAYLSRFFPNVITVAASYKVKNGDGRIVDRLTGFSNYGVHSVQIAAPGAQINSTLIADAKGKMSGTSMAAPMVCGVAARIRKNFPQISAADVRRILERTVQPLDYQQAVISTNGIIDPAAAYALASKWKPEMRSDLGKTLANLRKAPDTAPTLGQNAVRHALAPTAKTDKAVVQLAGNTDTWFAATRSITGPLTPQTFFNPVKEISGTEHQKMRDNGFELIDLAGGEGGWTLLYQKAPGKFPQRLRGYDFNDSVIAEDIKEGFHIQTVAGGKGNQWVVVMKNDNKKREQRFTRPRAFDDSLKKWISARWKESYRITSLDGHGDQWVVVMDRVPPGSPDQTISYPNSWPQEWINKKGKDGYQLSIAGGSKGKWVVVMDEVKKSAKDRYKISKDFPTDWLKHEWGM